MDKKSLLILKEVSKAGDISCLDLLNRLNGKIDPSEADEIILFLALDGYIRTDSLAPLSRSSRPINFNHISLAGKGIDALGSSKERKAYEVESLIASWLAAVFALTGLLLQVLPHVSQWLSNYIR